MYSTIILSCIVIVVNASLYGFIYVGECILGFNPWIYLLNHGCYCGFGNYENSTPMDGYDTCCMLHDACYGNLTDDGTCGSVWEQYILPYTVHCEGCIAACEAAFPFSLFKRFRECARGLCACDALMMDCWRDVQWRAGNIHARPDKKRCYLANATEGEQPEGTWFEKFLVFMQFHANKPWSEYVHENSVENLNRLPESKCRLEAKEPQFVDDNNIKPLPLPPEVRKTDEIPNHIERIIRKRDHNRFDGNQPYYDVQYS